MALSKDEVVILKNARELGDMMSTPGWKVYKDLLNAQMVTRQNIIIAPVHQVPDLAGEGIDGMTRVCALEHIKGVYNGLQLALVMPQTILTEAERLREKANLSQPEE